MKEDIEQRIIDLNDQVTHLYEQGEYEQAIAIAQQVRQIAERHLPPNHRHAVDSLNTLAVLFVANGDYTTAGPLQERALQLYRDILEPDDPTLVVALSNAANVYELKGDYAKAEPLLHEALERTLKMRGEHTPDHALCLNNLALFYYRLRQYARARPYFLQAMKIYREEGMEEDSDFANTLDNLAGLYEAMGQYEQARPLYEEALQMREKICGKDHPDYASSLNNLAYLYESMKNYSAAEALYQEALQIREDTLGKQHPDVADTLNNLAEVYEAIGNYRQAEPLFQRALAIRQATLGDAHPQVAQSLHNLAGLYAATHRVNEALDEMKNAAAINDGMIGHIFSMSSEEQRMEYLTTLRGQFAAFLSLVVQHLSQSPAALQAAFELVLRRKAIGAEALSIQRDAVLEKRYSNLAKKMHTLTQLRAQIARETMDGPLLEGVQAYQQRLRELHTRKNRLEVEIVRQIPEMNLAQKLQSVDRHIVASLLPVNATLVEFVRFPLFNFDALPAQGEFYWGQEYYVAFVLSSQRPDQVQMIKLGEAKSIEEKIASFRKAITGEDEENPMRESAPLHPPLTTEASSELSEDKLRHLAAVPGTGDTNTFFPEGRIYGKRSLTLFFLHSMGTRGCSSPLMGTSLVCHLKYCPPMMESTSSMTIASAI